jgi:hypothetical protein
MDISGLSTVQTASDMLTWLAQNCITPINPVMTGSDFGSIMAKIIEVSGGGTVPDQQIVAYLQGLPGYVGDGSTFLTDDLTWRSTGVIFLTSPVPGLVVTSPTAVTINWLPIRGAASYAIERALDNGFTTSVETVYTGSAISFNDTSLTAEVQYFYRLKAVAPGLPDTGWSVTLSNVDGE